MGIRVQLVGVRVQLVGVRVQLVAISGQVDWDHMQYMGSSGQLDGRLWMLEDSQYGIHCKMFCFKKTIHTKTLEESLSTQILHQRQQNIKTNIYITKTQHTKTIEL